MRADSAKSIHGSVESAHLILSDNRLHIAKCFYALLHLHLPLSSVTFSCLYHFLYLPLMKKYVVFSKQAVLYLFLWWSKRFVNCTVLHTTFMTSYCMPYSKASIIIIIKLECERLQENIPFPFFVMVFAYWSHYK